MSVSRLGVEGKIPFCPKHEVACTVDLLSLKYSCPWCDFTRTYDEIINGLPGTETTR